jgi:N-hydroxyarylamine O-acetyltransferase
VERGEFADRYLVRLGLDPPAGPTATALCAMHQAHLTRIPFENLDMHLGVLIALDLEGLSEKVLVRRRGGFCYELNGLFAELLSVLGFRVTLLGARVWGEHGFGPPLGHLVLRVGCADDPTEWLADVGFGAHSLFPLRVVPQLRQDDPGGVFRIEPVGNGDLDVLRDGTVQYRVEPHARTLTAFEAMCWYQQTSPRSSFTTAPLASLQTGRGRVTLSGDLLIRTEDGVRHEQVLPDDAELLETYRGVFGIDLDRVPTRQVGSDPVGSGA